MIEVFSQNATPINLVPWDIHLYRPSRIFGFDRKKQNDIKKVKKFQFLNPMQFLNSLYRTLKNFPESPTVPKKLRRGTL